MNENFPINQKKEICMANSRLSLTLLLLFSSGSLQLAALPESENYENPLSAPMDSRAPGQEEGNRIHRTPDDLDSHQEERRIHEAPDTPLFQLAI